VAYSLSVTAELLVVYFSVFVKNDGSSRLMHLLHGDPMLS